MTVRLLTNIGRLWTGTDLLSNAAMLLRDDRGASVGPPPQLPQSLPGVLGDLVDDDEVENLGGGLVSPGLVDAPSHPFYAGNRYAGVAMRAGGATMAEISGAGGGV